MSSQRQHRLAAIFAADVVGYSRLIAADEAGTLAAMRAHRRELWDPATAASGGRLVGTAGDSRLVEFPSAVAAVECAVAIQQAMVARNDPLDEAKRVRLRIGINLGEVVVDGDNIHGDGVNIAARLESEAHADGICVSDDILRQVRGRLDVEFTDGGERALKNIPQPVHIWHWLASSPAPRAAEAPPALPDKPSIAVLPFENMSQDREQDFFADGMSEDVITSLSQFEWLFVIARNSTFTFKGQATDIAEVAKTLGVGYVLEGSVRKAGNKVRVTAQLIEAANGSHVWAERYDRELEDIFAVQDEITEAIVGAIAPEIDEAERRIAQRRPPESLDAWGRYQRGLAAYYSTTHDGLVSAIRQFDEVNDLDPTFAPAFASGADARYRLMLHYDSDGDVLMKQAQEKALQAIALEPRNPLCLTTSARMFSFQGQHDLAISKAREAIDLNPNSAMANYGLGFFLGRSGQCEAALPYLDRAIRLSPRDAFSPGFVGVRAMMLFQLERYEEAAEWGLKASGSPNSRPGILYWAAGALIKAGRDGEAKALLEELNRRVPDASLSDLRARMRLTLPRATAAVETLIEVLREAGVPE